MWIKICGNTTLEDAQFAADAGADALGFIFAPSPRQVDADQVHRITEKLPQHVEKYGVFVDAGFDEIVSTVAKCGLTGVQLHRTSDPLLPLHLRQRFQKPFAIVSVVHYKDETFEHQLTGLSRHDALDAVLVDSSSARAVGGTGTSYDWLKARSTFLRLAPHLRLIAAGGLAPENIKQAIETLQPWGVDVVSGVESTPGKKDPERVFAFIRAAHQPEEETMLEKRGKS
jgi:phosphoribosylanthranilate isomerase